VVVGDRAYAADPETVAACGTAFIRATLEEGLVPVAKHFPGHGRTPLDSHLVLPEVNASIDELDRIELTPFRRALGAGCPAVMISHVRYGTLDPEWPASQSVDVIGGLLRRRLSFDGLVLSDDLEMAAVRSRWGVGPTAARFLIAGGDLALVCREAPDQEEALREVARALETGALPPSAALAARGRRVGLREWVEQARPRPDVGVIGCVEHRELVNEILGRVGLAGSEAPGG